jgi:predicted nucleic acid-binding Zn ribbon protein
MKKRKCVFCGLYFEAFPSSKRIFCSRWCSEMDRLVEYDREKERRKKPCVICGTPFSPRPYRAKRSVCCSYQCSQVLNGRKGGTVRGEQVKAKSEGKAYTKTKGRHTHRVVAERFIGRCLAPGEVVHHIDGDRLNNDPSNLMILNSQAEHARIHQFTEWLFKVWSKSWSLISSPEEAAHLSAV